MPVVTLVAHHVQPLQNRSQVRRHAAAFVFPSLPARQLSSRKYSVSFAIKIWVAFFDAIW